MRALLLWYFFLSLYYVLYLNLTIILRSLNITLFFTQALLLDSTLHVNLHKYILSCRALDTETQTRWQNLHVQGRICLLTYHLFSFECLFLLSHCLYQACFITMLFIKSSLYLFILELNIFWKQVYWKQCR